ncbi:MAG TPA: cbb3-type cytochrome c oxidase subunit I [Steroidobacteraceae bacterium]|nr:cbb3-type cytochrome c oxidase subunit I [Steroidobacteraceae bacterium]
MTPDAEPLEEAPPLEVRQAQEARLHAAWNPPTGWRYFSEVNNSAVGMWYTALTVAFLVFGGVLALLMRIQLAVPGNTFLSPETYNQVFTVHGSVMMFLVAIPLFEAISILFLPPFLGTRELPFPRLSAFGLWAFLIGGVFLSGSILFGAAPNGGWFMYPPLTSRYEPGIGADMWLLGFSFIEVAAIAASVELIIGVLKSRPVGMRINLIPLYGWYVLVAAVMVLFAFPSLIAGSLLLELERAFDWPFFDPTRGGDPLLWQHLFWLFGHPDVYIIFLPGAGLVSMIVATMAQRPLVGYRWVVVALLGTGLVSFALWVHHMFAVGLPHASASLFSAASMAVSVPAGIQVFAWLATLRSGRVRLATPTWFILGFFGIFVLGGLTGVMLAVVPFDWQAHDTYFVVAHLHYVVIGGMVFPVFAAIYYWAPMISGKPLSERMGKWACGLMFVGMNAAFFPMHVSGLLGMPRRVWTYPAGLGWELWNLLSTVGAFVLAAGVALVLLDLLLHLRPAGKVDVNPWNAGTLEWLPLDTYASRSIPRVSSRDPLWDNPRLRDEVDAGQHYLPGLATGERETLVTSPIEAEPQYLLRLPGPSWLPLLAGLGTATFFFALTVKWVWIAVGGAALALFGIVRWLWASDPRPLAGSFEVGDGIRLPAYMTGSRSHAWWAVVVLLLVEGSVFASLVFSYLFLWTVAPGAWPPAPLPLPEPAAAGVAVVGYVAALVAISWAGRALAASHSRTLTLALVAGAALLALAFSSDWRAALDAGIDARRHAYGAAVHALLAWQGLHVALVAIVTVYVLARLRAGLLGREHRVTFDTLRLLWLYTAAQGLVTIAVVHSPRIVA